MPVAILSSPMISVRFSLSDQSIVVLLHTGCAVTCFRLVRARISKQDPHNIGEGNYNKEIPNFPRSHKISDASMAYIPPKLSWHAFAYSRMQSDEMDRTKEPQGEANEIALCERVCAHLSGS